MGPVPFALGSKEEALSNRVIAQRGAGGSELAYKSAVLNWEQKKSPASDGNSRNQCSPFPAGPPQAFAGSSGNGVPGQPLPIVTSEHAAQEAWKRMGLVQGLLGPAHLLGPLLSDAPQS